MDLYPQTDCMIFQTPIRFDPNDVGHSPMTNTRAAISSAFQRQHDAVIRTEDTNKQEVMRNFDYNGKEQPNQITPIGQYQADKIQEGNSKSEFSTNGRDISSFPTTPNEKPSPIKSRPESLTNKRISPFKKTQVAEKPKAKDIAMNVRRQTSPEPETSKKETSPSNYAI